MLRPSYRWQDPPPPAVKYRRERASIRRFERVQIVGRTEVTVEPPAPAAPVLVVDGVEYVEAPELTLGCDGCAAEDDANLCTRLCKASYLAWGHDCTNSERIYLRKG